MSTTLNPETLTVLRAVATPDEIVTFQMILDDLAWGHCNQNMAEFVIEIVRRLAGLALRQNAPQRPSDA